MNLVLGVGNLLWADEGFGVRCVEELHRRYEVSGATLMDGGTQGLLLVEHVGGVEHLLVFDALDWDELPGTLCILRGEQIPRVYATGKVSLHQAGVWDVLSAADLLGRPPREVVVVGVQAKDLEDYGGSLTPEVAAKVDAALEEAIVLLRGWGVEVTPRAHPLPVAEGIMPPGLDRVAYERAS